MQYLATCTFFLGLYVKLAKLVVMIRSVLPPTVQEILIRRKDEDKKGLFLSGAPRLFLGRLTPPKKMGGRTMGARMTIQKSKTFRI